MTTLEVILPVGEPSASLAETVAALAEHRDTVAFSVLAVARADGELVEELLGPLRAKVDAGGAEASPEGVHGCSALWVAPLPEHGRVPDFAAAVNTGLEGSEARFAIALEPGDRLVPGALGRLVRAAQRGGLGGSVGAWAACDERGKRLGPEYDPPGARIGFETLIEGFDPPSACVLWDREVLGTGGGAPRFGRGLHGMEAADLLLRLSEQGIRLSACEGVVTLRRRDTGPEVDRFRSAADAAEGMIRRAFQRGATLGLEVAGVDLSETRERHAILGAALRIATRAALADPDPRRPVATELLRPRAWREAITPELAALAAVDALRETEGFVPTIDGSAERLWCRALRGWWSRCAGERWAEKDLVDRGPGLLAELMVGRAETATAIMGDLAGLWAPGERLFVVGEGAESHAMAAHAARAGCRVALLVPDHRRTGRWPLTGAEVCPIGATGTVEVMGLRASVGTEAPLVVIDTETGADLLRRYAGRPNVVRWSGGRRTLVERARARLMDAWHRRSPASA